MERAKPQDLSLLAELPAVQKGDEAAFQRIYKATWNRLYQVVSVRIEDQDEVQDILQDVYIRFWERRDTLNIEESVTGYLVQMAHHEVIRRIRQAIRGRDILSVYRRLIADSLYPSYVQLFATELEKQLEEEIDRLPPQQQLIYRLHTMEHRSASEISTRLNLAEQTVKNQLSTANRKIRSAMKTSLLLAVILGCFL